MVERDDRLDVGSEQRVHQVAVKGQARRVDIAAAAGNHTRPGHREAEVADAKALHECDVFRVPVVEIISDVCCKFSEAPSQPAVSGLGVTANQEQGAIPSPGPHTRLIVVDVPWGGSKVVPDGWRPACLADGALYLWRWPASQVVALPDRHCSIILAAAVQQGVLHSIK